ncbi:hypothetical protein B7P43_G16582 [Cryptotermes secundus]|uniref:PiggyBac transposable element-derived protein domain-containing protein n=1 Tax=Cryptotermes secundus TaxID=105785 RepID=A0A2J7RJ20_9NEOP|nr:hypothetical protein B7P43_G16582 [Cryptotermes secundus]
MASFHLAEDEIEKQLIIDTDSDCGTEYSDSGEEITGSEPEVDEDPSSSSATRGPPQQRGKRSVNNYSGGAVGLNTNEAPHVNKDSTPFCVFILYFAGIIRLLVEEMNRYYHQHVERCQDGPSPQPDVTESEMFLFLGIIIQMGHDNRGRLKDYWPTLEQFATPFYSKTMKRDRFLHILRFLHFADNSTEIDRNADSYDYGKFGPSSTLNDAFEKYYNPSEDLAIDKIVVKYKGRVVLDSTFLRNTNVSESKSSKFVTPLGILMT